MKQNEREDPHIKRVFVDASTEASIAARANLGGANSSIPLRSFVGGIHFVLDSHGVTDPEAF